MQVHLVPDGLCASDEICSNLKQNVRTMPKRAQVLLKLFSDLDYRQQRAKQIWFEIVSNLLCCRTHSTFRPDILLRIARIRPDLLPPRIDTRPTRHGSVIWHRSVADHRVVPEPRMLAGHPAWLVVRTVRVARRTIVRSIAHIHASIYLFNMMENS